MSVTIKKQEANAVTVCVRIRPQNGAERAAEMAVVMKATVRTKRIIIIIKLILKR